MLLLNSLRINISLIVISLSCLIILILTPQEFFWYKYFALFYALYTPLLYFISLFLLIICVKFIIYQFKLKKIKNVILLSTVGLLYLYKFLYLILPGFQFLVAYNDIYVSSFLSCISLIISLYLIHNKNSFLI